MIHATLDQLETRLSGATLPDAERAELLALVGTLRTQVDEVLTAHPGTVELRGPLQDLSVAVDQFGASHPDVKRALDTVVEALGRIGL